MNYVIPANEGSGLAGIWNYRYGYATYDGSPTTITYPLSGGLLSELVETRYDSTTGLPTELSSNLTGVGQYVIGQDYTRYGEPTLTTRQTDSDLYVQPTTTPSPGG
ncbi:hypothetical protein ACN268_30380 [Micromonospora sp. WMMD735]|uniref:hypothetical protein n=1 Tax=Micromonospora sp. WMMD735 TaxID=3404130 RepID=UPI003B932F72